MIGHSPTQGRDCRARGGVADGVACVRTTFNNTMVTVADAHGNVVFWTSSGKQGFRGSRKSTSFAAQSAGESAARAAMEHGMRTLRVRVSGPGTGRESAIRAIYGSGIKIVALEDATAIPHNGCKPPKRRRV
ncbi:30S ribosomal protein S11 [Candidatus Tremblaya princeps]|uniref:Small ribosomal subunit protein uS11 n=1 Tax=Tremblaya princeps TaxID=189385 RepID=A0A143WR02_TREPR|nr:30S ribosomal protein S11 [Candidatus Tremblaya princeps]